MISRSKIPVRPSMKNQSPQILNQVPHVIYRHQSWMLAQTQAMERQSQLMVMGQSQLMNQPHQIFKNCQAMAPLPTANRGYKPWLPKQLSGDSSTKFPAPSRPNYLKQKRSHWKGKKGVDKRKDGKRTESNVGISGRKPPFLKRLQTQTPWEGKKLNNRFATYAPRNTTSFIIRAKKSGGIASLVSPCPATPAVLTIPEFSPCREALGDMARDEWGVDGYGSMKGMIRLRSPTSEKTLDHDSSRFEMIYLNYALDCI